MPTIEHWNGRFAHVGNGVDSGSISYAYMGVPLTKYGFAVASTNAGHNGTGLDGTFAMNNPEAQFDFGYRAVHLSTMFSKIVVGEYYQQNATYNYWLGCSAGGMREVQGFPEDFDGALTGAPAQFLSRQNGWNVHVGELNIDGYAPGETIPTSFFPLWAEEVASQCDELDGVKDGIISSPNLCSPDTSTVICGAVNASAYINSTTCLTESQETTLQAIYKNWTSTETGELIFPAHQPGSEAGWDHLIDGTVFQPGSDFFLYQVYNYTTVQTSLRVNATELERITAIGDQTDPGLGNAVNPDLTPFFNRGGKLLTYHGTGDSNIPSVSSTLYYEKVRAFFNSSTSWRDNYRLFLIPGMGHCQGNSADGFGGAIQSDDSQGGNGQSMSFDADHDAVLALMRWVENGTAPESIVGAKYVGDNRTAGVEYTRLFCPYPQEGKYIGGDATNATGYECE
ncbi:putative feruloyl esterase B-2 [Rhizoctonia solani]|uniref:Carboxylic ester hydrolase n=1 Tax=Rhizoctonia solani TaxID=456999 RepID=A0A0K6GDR6_9AGAM|nr:putative feruloyl esterase B-2 [Rhizoctonia solani]